MYLVATNSFTAGGGDGYTAFRDVADRWDTGILLRDAVIDLLRRDRRVVPVPERRVRFIGG
jgi:hypothetical protein